MSKKSASSIVKSIAKARGEDEESVVSRVVNRAVSIHQKKESAAKEFPPSLENQTVGVHTPAVVAVKFRPEEIEAIDAQCKRNGRMSRSAWIRAAAHRALQTA